MTDVQALLEIDQVEAVQFTNDGKCILLCEPGPIGQPGVQALVDAKKVLVGEGWSVARRNQ